VREALARFGLTSHTMAAERERALRVASRPRPHAPLWKTSGGSGRVDLVLGDIELEGLGDFLDAVRTLPISSNASLNLTVDEVKSSTHFLCFRLPEAGGDVQPARTTIEPSTTTDMLGVEQHVSRSAWRTPVVLRLPQRPRRPPLLNIELWGDNDGSGTHAGAAHRLLAVAQACLDESLAGKAASRPGVVALDADGVAHAKASLRAELLFHRVDLHLTFAFRPAHES
jgi:hypothetical protein